MFGLCICFVGSFVYHNIVWIDIARIPFIFCVPLGVGSSMVALVIEQDFSMERQL
jgi:hypothetical protein